MRHPFSRREFLATTAASAAAATLAPAGLPASFWTNAPDRIKVGLIGCGGRGTGAAVNALSADPGAVLWAMGDTFADRVESCHANLDAHAKEQQEASETAWDGRLQVPEDRRFSGLDAWQKVIDSGVDVVLLCTTPAFRPMQLAAAVAAGKHVFCEKPVAVDAAGIRSVLASAKLAQAKRLSLVCGFCWRYHEPEQASFARLHEGGIGDVRSIYTTYNAGGFPDPKPRQPEWSDAEFQLRNWHYFSYFSGDHIVEQAIHALDWMDWAMKGVPPDSVICSGGRAARPNTPETGNIFDHFAATFEYPSGVKGFHMSRHFPNCANDNSAYIAGTKGVFTMHPWTPSHIIEGETPWKYAGKSGDMYLSEHMVLFRSIRDADGHNDGDWMARSTSLGIMARMAAYTGQSVTWKHLIESAENMVPTIREWGSIPTPTLAVPGRSKLV